MDFLETCSVSLMALRQNLWIFCFPGGGFHHCSSDRGGGFCAYADITLAIKVKLNQTLSFLDSPLFNTLTWHSLLKLPLLKNQGMNPNAQLEKGKFSLEQP